MSRLFLFESLSSVLAVGVMLAGCSNQQPAAQPDAAHHDPAATDHNEQEGHDRGDSAHSGHDASGHAGHSDHNGHGQYAEALAKLSEEDRALAEKQEACPVSGQPLGSMGTPYKVTVQGREVFLCCSGCESKIKDDPEEYLAKLSE
jgi:YHS domain-containing protein